MKYCKRPVVSDIVLRVGDEDPHVDSIDYSRLLSPSQNEALKSAQPVSTSPIAAGASTAANDKRASFGRSLNESYDENNASMLSQGASRLLHQQSYDSSGSAF